MLAAEVEDTYSLTYSFLFLFQYPEVLEYSLEPRHQHELGFLLLSVGVILVYFLIY